MSRPTPAAADEIVAPPDRRRRRWLPIAVVAVLIAGSLAALGLRQLLSPGWQLSWSDNFNGTSLDQSKWTAENDSTFGNGNGELACLMSGANNVVVRDGTLTLQARREAPPVKCGSQDTRFPAGRSYTSAMISTKGKAAWHEGRFEIRAKLPLGAGDSKGLWPAFWLRPQSGSGDGELDVMEAVGTDKTDLSDSNTVHQTLWYDLNKTYPKQSQVVQYANGKPATDYHTYAAEWRAGKIRWYVDGKLTYQRDSTTAPWLDKAFNGNFFIRLNLAVGGTFPGAPTSDTQLPAGMVIDWVKVYQWR